MACSECNAAVRVTAADDEDDDDADMDAAELKDEEWCDECCGSKRTSSETAPTATMIRTRDADDAEEGEEDDDGDSMCRHETCSAESGGGGEEVRNRGQRHAAVRHI